MAYDYAQRIAVGNVAAYRTLDGSLSRLAANSSAVVDFRSCPLLNVSICPAIRAAGDRFTALLYNPQARPRVDYVTLPLYTANVTVTDSAGHVLPSDVVPIPRTSAHTAASATHAVVFGPYGGSSGGWPGLGFETVTIAPVQEASARQSPQSGLLPRLLRKGEAVKAGAPQMQRPSAATASIENAAVRLSFDNATGLVTSWTDKSSGTVHPFVQQLFYYNSSTQGRYGISTLYTFQPWPNSTLIPVSTEPVELSLFVSARVQMVHQRWNDWLSQTWRLVGDDYPEVEWTVGPIAFEDGRSREIVTRYTTDLATNGELWTDANGREFQRRLLNRRSSYNLTIVSPISSNYYPVTTAAYINDSQTRFAVLVDRAQGAASLQDGAVELMLHRRLLCQDGCAFENLNETDAAEYSVRTGDLVRRLGQGLIITGHHTLVMGATRDVILAVRRLQQRLYTPIHPVFAATSALPSTKEQGVDARLGRLSFLRTALPEGVELMTLQVLFDGSVLLRLAHSFAIDEPGAGPITVDLSALFVQPITSIKQRTLTANGEYKVGARVRLPYATDQQVSDEEWARLDRMHAGLKDSTITIYPMQVVAFALRF